MFPLSKWFLFYLFFLLFQLDFVYKFLHNISFTVNECVLFPCSFSQWGAINFHVIFLHHSCGVFWWLVFGVKGFYLVMAETNYNWFRFDNAKHQEYERKECEVGMTKIYAYINQVTDLSTRDFHFYTERISEYEIYYSEWCTVYFCFLFFSCLGIRMIN